MSAVRPPAPQVVLEDLETRLPKDLLQAFSTGDFVTSCNERYDELATTRCEYLCRTLSFWPFPFGPFPEATPQRFRPSI